MLSLTKSFRLFNLTRMHNTSALHKLCGKGTNASVAASWAHDQQPQTFHRHSSTDTTGTGGSPPSEHFIMHRGVQLKVRMDMGTDDDFRTQRKPIYKLPYYGATDQEINALSDLEAQKALKCYGGLIRKNEDGDTWRTRLRRATRSWHLPDKLTIKGTVVSNKMDKSVVIAARRRKFHQVLQIPYFRTRRYMAHDEFNVCREGDEVVIRSCRPLSKHKFHVVVINYGDKLAIGDEDRKADLFEKLYKGPRSSFPRSKVEVPWRQNDAHIDETRIRIG